MADNIMGGNNSPEDIIANIGVNLNNIDSSIADATSLADQIRQWSIDNEAFTKSLADTQAALGGITSELEKQVELRQAAVEAETQLRDIAAVSKQNVQDTANYYRDISGVLSNMSSNLNVIGALGATALPGIAGNTTSGNNGAPMMLGDPSVSEEAGMPSSASSSGMGGNLFQSVMMGMTGKTSNPLTSVGKNETPLTAEELEASAKASRVHNMMNIPYYLPGGKASLALRYADRLMNGKLSQKMATKPWITGSADHAAAQKAFEDAGGSGTYLDAKNMTAGELESAGIDAGAVAAGDAALLSGGLLGLASAASPYLAAAYAANKVYQGYATYQQQGQLLGSLTGNSSASTMVQYEGQNFISSFLNPRLSYGAAKDITMTGLAAGLNDNGQTGGFFGTPGGLLGQYTNLATGMYQQYGMSSQDSMQFFQAGVIQAGASVSSLSDALNSLAKVSAETNTSFASLKQNFLSYTETFAGLGMTGNQATAMATAASLTNVNNPLLGGAGSTASLLNNTAGQALAAQAAGIPFTQLYNVMGTEGGASMIATASNTAFLNILKGLGLTPGMPNLEQAVGSVWYQLTQLLPQLGIQPPNGAKEWTAETAVKYTIQALSGHGTGESVTQGTINSASTAISKLTGNVNPYSAQGVANTLSNLNKAEISHQGTDLVNGSLAQTEYRFNLNGKTMTESGEWIASQSASVRDQIEKMILNGQATVGLVNGAGQTVGFNKNNTSGALTGSAALQNLQQNPQTLKGMIDLSPSAAALFKLITNPQAYGNLTTQQKSRMGFDTNTTQESTGIPFIWNNGGSWNGTWEPWHWSY